LDADTKPADTTPQDPIASLVAQGTEELDEETKQEEDAIQKKFDAQMEICKNKTQAQEEYQSFLKLSLKGMKHYELQLQAAEKELSNSQSSLKEMIAKQANFFSRTAQTLAKLQESTAPKLESTSETQKSLKPADSKMDLTKLNEKEATVKTDVKTDQKSEKEGTVKTDAKIDQKSVAAIVNMGFAPSDAKDALRNNGGSLERATKALKGLVTTP